MAIVTALRLSSSDLLNKLCQLYKSINLSPANSVYQARGKPSQKCQFDEQELKRFNLLLEEYNGKHF